MEIKKKDSNAMKFVDLKAGQVFKAMGQNYFMKCSKGAIITNPQCAMNLRSGEVRQFQEDQEVKPVESSMEVVD